VPEVLLDAAGRRRSPATMPPFHAGRPPRNKGVRYPPDPPTVEEIVSAMRAAGDTLHGGRLRGLIVVLWRAGLRISEALSLGEGDLDPRRGSVLVRRGKGGRRREVGMDDWAWEQLQPWLGGRRDLPVGPLFCGHCGVHWRRKRAKPNEAGVRSSPSSVDGSGRLRCRLQRLGFRLQERVGDPVAESQEAGCGQR
jgi:integrase